jgi:hypothetical protein
MLPLLPVLLLSHKSVTNYEFELYNIERNTHVPPTSSSDDSQGTLATKGAATA